MLASEYFSRAPALSRFLAYVCEQTFEGKAAGLKEYSIAVEAFGRAESFDHTRDSIVRVEAHKLRQRLRSYYDTVGPRHGVYIEVPPGQYAPVFRFRAANGGEESLAPPEPERVPAPRPRMVVSSLPAVEVLRPRRGRLVAGLALAGALALALVLFAPGEEPSSASLGPSLDIVPAEPVYRISAGAGPAARYVDELGRTWSGDAHFEGGRSVVAPEATIQHTDSPDLYRFRREGEFAYALPVEPGVYELHLHFAELEEKPGDPNRTQVGERTFNIVLNDAEQAFTRFDVLATAGSPNEPVELVVRDLEPTAEGVIKVRMAHVAGEPMLAGLELFRGIPGKGLPIRLLCGRSTNFRNGEGAHWSADRYFQGGRSVPRSNPVSATDNPNLYAAERYGNFRYRVPVALGGRYTVKLHFVEQWWGESNHGGGGAGSRLFDVYCNGVALLRDFDVYAEAGGENRALVKTFPGLAPNLQGLLDLSFVPTANYAVINAIEVLAE